MLVYFTRCKLLTNILSIGSVVYKLLMQTVADTCSRPLVTSKASNVRRGCRLGVIIYPQLGSSPADTRRRGVACVSSYSKVGFTPTDPTLVAASPKWSAMCLFLP